MGDAEAVEFSCLLVPVAEVTPDRQAALEEPQRGLRLALLLQQYPEPVRQLGQRRSAVPGGQVDGPLQPPPPFGEVAMPVPEIGQRLDQPQAGSRPFAVAGRRARGRGFQRPGQGGAQVVMLGLQPVQGRQVRRARAAQLLVRPFGDPGVVLGVAAPGVVQVPGPLQPLERVLADRLQHADAGLAVGAVGHRDQADVQQPGGQIQGIGPDPLGVRAVLWRGDRGQRVQVAAPGEHPGAAERLGQVGGQQVVAPGDGVPQGLLPRRLPDVGGGQVDAAAQAGQQGPGGQQPDPGRGQLDGQRQPVQALADGRDVGGVGRR